MHKENYRKLVKMCKFYVASFNAGLSKWVRSKVQTFENFSQTLDSLSVFTEQMIQEMPVVEWVLHIKTVEQIRMVFGDN